METKIYNLYHRIMEFDNKASIPLWELGSNQNKDMKIQVIEDFINNIPFKKQELTKSSGYRNPCYVPLLDSIIMPLFEDFESSKSYYSCFFHELIHWSAKRVERPIFVLSRKQQMLEELVAEIGSFFLSKQWGLMFVIEDYSINYMKNWIEFGKGDKNDFAYAYVNALRSFDYFMNIENRYE